MENEIFRDIQGFEGLYQVSTCGRVKSLNYNHTGEERILKQGKDRDGYLQVNLHKDKKRKTFKVHRLVADAFIPNPENKPEVNHKDENPSNNCVENLEWCTHQYNIDYSQSKKIICVETETVYQSIMEAQRKTGISNTSISACCNGNRKTAGKFHWKYVK